MGRMIFFGMVCALMGYYIGFWEAKKKFISRVEKRLAEAKAILREIEEVDAEAGDRLDQLRDLYK